MQKTEINIVNMFQTTNLVLTQPAHASIWSGLPAFVRGQGRLAGSINILAALAQSQGTVLKGITVDKDRLQLSVITRLENVAGMAGPYAFESGNETLGAKFKISFGKMANTRDGLLADLAQGIHDEADTLVAAQPAKLAEYGLTPLILTDLQSAITAYRSVLGTPRAAISNRSADTQAIAAEIKRASLHLDQVLDRLMLQFRAENLAFFNAYESARKIVDTGGGSAAPDVTPATPLPPAQ